MEKLKRVYAVQDENGHWYVIPFDLKDAFFQLEEKIGSENQTEFEEAEEEFDNLFNQYRTGGDLNNIELYASL